MAATLMRVRVDLFYRDASNYKLSGSVTFAGPLRHEDVLRFEKTMVCDMGFVPSAVGISHLAFDPDVRSDDDQPWHDVTCVALEDGDPEDNRTFAEFVAECERANWEEAGEAWERDTPVKTSNDDDDDDWLDDAA